MHALALRENVRHDKVPLLDLKAQYASIEQEVLAALRHVCASQQFILGPHVSELEKRVAEYSGCRFGIGVSSGSDALLLALMACGIGPGDEVITTAYSFFATAGAIARLGARPVFCDIDPATFNLSAESVKRLLGEVADQSGGTLVNRTSGGRIKALLPVHLFGQVADMERLTAIASEHGLRVIEDAAQAIGSTWSGRRAGSMGDVGCFSFFPSKNLGAFGDAGMCTTNDEELAERMRVLRSHGAKPKYHHALIGGNFRLDEMQAAILLVKFKYLDAWTSARQRNAAFYDAEIRRTGLSRHLTAPMAVDGHRHIYNQYVIRARDRDGLKRHLTNAEIGSEVYYPVPLHMQQCFAYLNHAESDCPEASRAARESLAIPIYPELNREQRERVIDALTDFYR